MKVLHIVETAYRATVEEQDDTILWLSHQLKNDGADLALLLRQSAVNYGVKGQDASGLVFGRKRVAHPPQLNRDLADLMKKKVPVYVVSEDLAERGIEKDSLLEGLQLISWNEVPKLLETFDFVWHW